MKYNLGVANFYFRNSFDLEFMAVKFYIEKDLKKCEALWRKFSPNNFLADLWEFRYCFFKAYGSEPYFVVGEKDSEIIGFIPLEYSHSAPLTDRYLFWGGGDWVEHTGFYVKHEVKKRLLPLFLENSPVPVELLCIDKSELEFTDKLGEDLPTYYLDLAKYHYQIDEYFAAFGSKSRQNIQYDLRKIEQLSPQIVLNQFSDYNGLVELNKERFGAESDFHEQGFSDVCKLMTQDKFLKEKLRLVSVYIVGELKASLLSIVDKDVYTCLQAGYDARITSLYKYLNFQVIQAAINLKVNRIDFLSDDCGWKEHWRLEKEMLYQYKN